MKFINPDFQVSKSKNKKVFKVCFGTRSSGTPCTILSDMAVNILKSLRLTSAAVVPHLSSRLFSASPVVDVRGKVNYGRLNRECEERTKLVLTDKRKLKSMYTPAKFTKNISELFKFFPLSPDKVETILMDHPAVLDYDASKVIEMIQVIVEAGDYDTVTQEEALLCIARYPQMLKLQVKDFKENLSNIFGVVAVYDIPWNVVMVASPVTILETPETIGFIVDHLSKYLPDTNIRDVIGNNPTLFEFSWEETEEKLKYLQFTMNVSAYRIAMTPYSLTKDLEFLKLRFEFLSRSGHYRHPDPGAKSAVPTEASPALHLITDTDNER